VKKEALKKSHISIIVFGVLLAVLAGILQFFEYRYFVGSLSTDIYVGVVATIFTLVGIWIGSRIIRSRYAVSQDARVIDQSIVKELNLNDREYEILTLISKGHSNQEIADQLFLALPTIKTHASNLYSKLDVNSRTQAIHKAKALKII
jgi:DNA-binding NarL/FixJ family response regulator